MAKITFSDENQAGDISTFEISKNELLSEYQTIVDDLIDTREGKVIVCFDTCEKADYENQVKGFFIGEDELDIEENYLLMIKDVDDKNINLNFFCFHTYEDAFGYCMDLKEGL